MLHREEDPRKVRITRRAALRLQEAGQAYSCAECSSRVVVALHPAEGYGVDQLTERAPPARALLQALGRWLRRGKRR